MRLPTFAEHRRFVEVDGWDDKDSVSKKKTGDHHRYIKTLENGETLQTRISHGSGQYRSPSLWAHIMRDQLRVTREEFWAAVDQGIVPTRPGTRPMRPKGEPKPVWLVDNLQRLVGLSLGEIAGMSKQQALNAWDEWRSQPLPDE